MSSKIAELLGFTVPKILALRKFHTTQKAVMMTASKHFRRMAEKEILSAHVISESTVKTLTFVLLLRRSSKIFHHPLKF